MLLHRPRADEFMRRHGLDVLVATSPVNVTYFTNYSIWLTLEPMKEYMVRPGSSSDPSLSVYALYPLDGEPALILAAALGASAEKIAVSDVRTAGDGRTVTDLLADALGERGLADARVGVELEGLGEHRRRLIVDALPKAKIKDCTNLIRLVRMVKGEEERFRLARALEITENALLESLSLARAGDMLAPLGDHFRIRVAEAGAIFAGKFIFVPYGRGFTPDLDYVLRKDDVLMFDVGCSYKQCFADVGTSLAMPDAPLALVQQYSLMAECVRDAAAAARPGVPASSVHATMGEAIQTRRLRASPPWGHGIGIEAHEYPAIVPDNGLRIRDECVDEPSDIPLEEGMIINLECKFLEPGGSSLNYEEVFLITAEGGQPLVPRDRSQPVRSSAAAKFS